MKHNCTELVFILDRSGSMAGLEADTIGGFNAMLEKQKQAPGEALVSTVLFSNQAQVIHDRLPLDKVAPMTRQDYQCWGCTALLDTIGDAVRHIRNIHKYARPEDVPEKTLFVITTDGMENASSRYTADQVRRLIREQEAEGWEFLFVAANIDAVGTAGRIGIKPTNAVNYHADTQGTEVLYETVAQAACSFRSGAPLAANWSDNIHRDYKSRKSRR